MQETEAAFNEYAVTYDDTFTFSAIGKLQRARVWKYLSSHVSPVTYPDVLELNCGTGEDAAWFARQGYTITSTDISEEMIRHAREKNKSEKAAFIQSDISEEMIRHAREKNKSEKAAFIQSDITDIGNKLFNKKFDLIFSDFGGINCLSPDALREMNIVFSKLLRPGGKMIFVIMSRNCKWEQWYFKRKNDLENAYRRRSKESVEAVIFDRKFSTWYYSPGEIGKLFAASFSVSRFRPIGYALPPSYLESYFKKHPLFLSALNFSEKMLGSFSSLADKADHFIIEFEKK